MGPEDLQKFIKLLESSSELKRIKVAVDPELEAAAIIDRICKQRDGGHALLFEAIEGAELPLAANLFGSEGRIASALGVETVESLVARFRHDLSATGKSTSAAALQQLTSNPEWQATVAQRPLCYTVDLTAKGLSALPALRSWPLDGGRYLTLGQVFTCHPDSGRGNCGMYRLQVVDSTTALLRCHPGSGGGDHLAAWHALGQPAPVAIALGGPPVLTLVAGMPLPATSDEVSFAGYLAGHALSLAGCRYSALRVPSSAEIVVEGTIAPGDARLEGPFGNHTGKYAQAASAPVFKVKGVWSRQAAICPGTVVGPPPMENVHLATAAARIMLPLLQFDHPWVKAVHLPIEGIYHRAAIVMVGDTDRSLEEIGGALKDSRVLQNSRLVVLVDEGCRPDDVSRVYWKIVNAGDWLSKIRVSSQQLVIDARSNESENLQMCEKTQLRVTNNWQGYGFDRE